MRPTSWLTIATCVLGVTGCGGASPLVETVRNRAAFDLQCSYGAVEILGIGQGVMRARGCGRGATYVCRGELCLLNGPIASETSEPDRSVAASVPPLGPMVAGFRIGTSRHQAEAACGGGPVVERPAEDVVIIRCASMPTTIELVTGAPTLAFCEGSLCGVLLRFQPATDDDPAWTDAIERMTATLSARYGQLGTVQEPVGGTEPCPGLDVTLAPLRSGRCRVRGRALAGELEVQLRVDGREGVLSAAIEYRTRTLVHALRSGEPPIPAPAIVGGDQL